VFSTLHSSAIDQDTIPQFTHTWTADDNVLEKKLNATEETGERIVPAKSFRQESTYNVDVEVSNAK